MKDRLLPALLILATLLAIVINCFGFMEGLDWGDDFAGYVLQARTLASGNFEDHTRHMQRTDFILNYPWGFPLLLAPVVNTFGSGPVFVKFYVYLFFILSLVIVYLLFKTQKHKALLTVLLMACSPFFWLFKNYLFSDFTNLLFVLLSLYLIQRTFIEAVASKRTWTSGILLGVCLFMSFATRSQSIVLLPTLLIVQVINRGKAGFLSASVPFVCFALCYLLFKVLIPIAPVSYINAYHDLDLVGTLSHNLKYYLNVWQELMAESRITDEVNGILTGALLVVAGAGLAIQAREKLHLLIFIFFSFALVLVTPFYQGLRYLMPVLPLFFYFLVHGVFLISKAISPSRAHLIATAFFVFFIAICFHTIIVLGHTNQTKGYVMDGPYKQTAREMLAYIQKETPKKACIGFFKPRAVLLYTGRDGVFPATHADCVKRDVSHYIWFSRADVPLISQDSLKNQALFRLKFQNADYQVYQVVGYRGPGSVNEHEEVTYTFSQKDILNNPAGPEQTIGIWSGHPLPVADVELGAGNYVIRLFTRGTPAGAVYPACSVMLGDSAIGSFKSEAETAGVDIGFTLANPLKTQLRLRMNNDLIIGKEDRNAFVYSLQVIRINP